MASGGGWSSLSNVPGMSRGLLFNIPKHHWSDAPLVRRIIDPTTHWSDAANEDYKVIT